MNRRVESLKQIMRVVDSDLKNLMRRKNVISQELNECNQELMEVINMESAERNSYYANEQNNLRYNFEIFFRELEFDRREIEERKMQTENDLDIVCRQLFEKFSELKKYELVLEKAIAESKLEAKVKEQKEIDELANNQFVSQKLDISDGETGC